MSASLVAVLGTGLVDPSTPILRADDLGVTRGDGCFEGCRVRTDASGHSRVDKLDAHLARMTRSAAGMEIPFDEPAWRELIATVCAAWTEPGETSLKLVLTRGLPGGAPTGYLMLSPLPAEYPRLRRDGLRVISLSRGTGERAFDEAPWLLGGIKSLSYAINMAAQREAARQGADDALFVSADGHVLESPTGSVVWAVDRSLRTTPTGASGILAGTTQELLFTNAAAAGWDVGSNAVTLPELHDADVVWLIGSVRGPVDIIELDGVVRERVPAVDAEIRGLCGF